MNKKTQSIVILSLLLMLGAILAAGCGTPKGTTPKAADQDEALSYTEPLAEQVLLALNTNDYAAFSQNMTDKMKGTLTEEAFGKLRQQLGDAAGEYKSRSVDRVVDSGEFISVYYKIEFSKVNSTMNMSFTKAEPHLIAGMYFQ